MKQALMGAAVAGVGLLLGGCFNLGTKSSEITPAFVPASQYQNESCRQLDIDRTSLYQRQSLLTTAQDQRRSSNKLQAFWVGFGNGDGVGASELAQVKGQILAIEKERNVKGCASQAAYVPASTRTAVSANAEPENGTWPLPLPKFDTNASCQGAGVNFNACMSAEQSARTWLAHHTTTVQIAGDCSAFAQQSYTMIQACVRQREGAMR